MKKIIKAIKAFCSFDYWQARCHLVVVVVFLFLAAFGQVPDSSAGWVIPLPKALVAYYLKRPTKGDRRRRRRAKKRVATLRKQRKVLAGHYLHHSWLIPNLRSLVLAICFLHVAPSLIYLSLLPIVLWAGQAVAIYSNTFATLPEWHLAKAMAQKVEQGLMLIALLWLTQQSYESLFNDSFLLAAGLCAQQVPTESNQVDLQSRRDKKGKITHYSATLKGEFSLEISNDDPFRLRMLILFLRELEVIDHTSIGRKTRDKRTPFVKQEDLAKAYAVSQPNISRWQKYWIDGDWRRLLSIRAPEILTLEVQDRIVSTFAQFPWWGNKKVYDYLHQQGVKVSHHQVKLAAQESGWNELRLQLRKKFTITADSFRPRDEWLMSQLLQKQAELISRLESTEQLPEQLKIELNDLAQMAEEIGVQEAVQQKALPWALRLEQLLFGDWETINDGKIRCIYCNCDQVARKSKKPRIKRYIDEEGQEQSVEVYRYYCRNKDCDKGSFTNLPVGLLPHSPYTLTRHLMALQIYGWAGSNYRRSAQALGVSSATVYRWVSGCGSKLLPIMLLFGVVRCTGVIGIDEKFVLVPKNDKEPGKMRRWMYVYVAVDCYTYDLLHIAIYRYRNEQTARIFLLELKAKGYRPRVVVTDLWNKYNGLIGEVFPAATHQECIFHALKEVQKKIKDIYGANYKEDAPEAVKLKEDIYYIFKAKTKRTARKRYDEVMSLQKEYVEKKPESQAVFTFLQKHWPRLLPAIESTLIPRTNNTAELVIRRFDQHYQNFCGFESIESAQQYLAVFEKLYRFTPFSQDAQPRLRGKCPLELAGYDVSQMPMATICAGLSPQLSNKKTDLMIDEEAQEAFAVAQQLPSEGQNLVPSL